MNRVVGDLKRAGGLEEITHELIVEEAVTLRRVEARFRVRQTHLRVQVLRVRVHGKANSNSHGARPVH